jgi:hypothetical protein
VADRFLGTSFQWDFGNTSFAPGIFDKIMLCMPIAPFVGVQAGTAVGRRDECCCNLSCLHGYDSSLSLPLFSQAYAYPELVVERLPG